MSGKQKSDKDVLMENIKKRVTTTMIGAIDSIEKKFGFLWSGENIDAQFMEKTFLEIRKSILDNGNTQIKLIQEELQLYEIERMKFNTVFPVIRNERLRNG